MSVFKSGGHEWQLHLDAPTIRAIRQELAFDLVAKDQTEWQKLHGNEVLLADLLWSLCRESAGNKGVAEKQFHAGLNAESLTAGLAAILEAVADFSPALNRASKLMRKALETDETYRAEAMTKAEASIEDPEIRAATVETIDRLLAEAKNEQLTRLRKLTVSRESSASVPAATPGGN